MRRRTGEYDSKSACGSFEGRSRGYGKCGIDRSLLKASLIRAPEQETWSRTLAMAGG